MPFTLSYKLQALGLNGSSAIVIRAERGWVTILECAMEDCYCPGGRGFFEKVVHKGDEERKNWIPTEDHFPIELGKQGRKVPENVRLAPRKCNRLGSGSERGHARVRDNADQDRKSELERFEGTPKQQAEAWARDRRREHPDWAPDFLAKHSPY